MALQHYGPNVESLFFPDGNTICLKTKDLLEILQYSRQLFPHLERITVYGSAKFILRKTSAELESLREAGLTRIHSGMESGDDITLERICKGADAQTIIQAGLKAKSAGLEISEYVLVGIGGRERWQEHALESARVLSAIDPDFIRLRTYHPERNTPLYDQLSRGEFELPSPHEALREVRLLVENLEGTGLLLSDHISNYCNINGKLPEAKNELLTKLDQALQVDECLLKKHIHRL
jgi:radical SAM superfamily enzyme YgiQ (UPF0313 family)